MQWFYLVQGQRQGPVDDAALEALVRQGTVRDDTYVWREGLAEWQTYGTVKPKPAPAPVPAPVPVPAPAPVPAAAPAAPPRPAEAYTAPQPGAPPYQQPSPAHPYLPPAAAAPAKTGSKGVFFFYPILEALNDGRFIRKCVIIALKVLAVIVALGGLLTALGIFTTMSRGSGAGLLGGILLAIMILASAACVAQVYWYRAGSVAALGHSHYTVIPIFAILSRAGGEAAATGLSGLGVGLCLGLWLSPDVGSLGQGIPYLGMVAGAGGFIGGIIALVYCAVIGFSALIFGYLWAECIMLLVDIEQNTRATAPNPGKSV
jgi:hypothetical protein